MVNWSRRVKLSENKFGHKTVIPESHLTAHLFPQQLNLSPIKFDSQHTSYVISLTYVHAK